MLFSLFWIYFPFPNFICSLLMLYSKNQVVLSDCEKKGQANLLADCVPVWIFRSIKIARDKVFLGKLTLSGQSFHFVFMMWPYPGEMMTLAFCLPSVSNLQWQGFPRAAIACWLPSTSWEWLWHTAWVLLLSFLFERAQCLLHRKKKSTALFDLIWL